VSSLQYVLVRSADWVHSSTHNCFLTVTVNKQVRNYVHSVTVLAFSVILFSCPEIRRTYGEKKIIVNKYVIHSSRQFLCEIL